MGKALSLRSFRAGRLARILNCGRRDACTASRQVIAATTISVFAILASASGSARAADAAVTSRSATNWISADAAVCLEIPHPDQLIDRLTDPRILDYASSLAQYRNLLQNKQFREFGTIVKLIAAQLDTTWDQGLKDLTGGGIVVAAEAEKATEPRVFVIITPKNESLLSRAHEALLKLARGDAAGKGKPDPVKTSDYHGVTVYTTGDGSAPSYAIVRGRLVASNSAKSLATLIDRIVQGAPDRSASGGTKLSDSAEWKALESKGSGGDSVRALARLDRLRKLDAARFTMSEKPDTGITLLFRSWYEMLKRAPWIAASIRWSEKELAAALELPLYKDGHLAIVKGFVPDGKEGTSGIIEPPGTIASLSLWRDWATIWESRADLFSPEVAQNLAQLDTVAGQFFGGREFGADFLGAFGPHWRLVVSQQDFNSLKPPPDLKLPSFAIVAEIAEPEGDFGQKLKTAYQTIVGLSNVDATQQKAAPLELGSEEVDGVTLATARYVLPQGGGGENLTPQRRYNFSPSAAQVGKYFILSSSRGLARVLIKELKGKAGGTNQGAVSRSTLAVEADGHELARILEENRDRFAMQTMLERGETKDKAQSQVDGMLAFVRYLGRGRLSVEDSPSASRLELKFQLKSGK
jgi:hypothetical protein